MRILGRSLAMHQHPITIFGKRLRAKSSSDFDAVEQRATEFASLPGRAAGSCRSDGPNELALISLPVRLLGIVEDYSGSPTGGETRMPQTERIIIRHIEGRRSERVAWLLEELGIPYELDFIQGDILGSLLALEQHHEMRMTPIVHIGDVVMVESGAILEYLLVKFGKGSSLRPNENSSEFPAYLEFLHFAEGTALAKIISDVADRQMRKALTAAGVEPPAPMKLPGLAGSRTGAQRVMHYAENTLAKRSHFAGNQFTAADIMMHFALKLGGPIAAGADFNVKAILRGETDYFVEFPKVKDFTLRMAARPAFQRAMKTTMPKGPPEM